jgi:sugar phosphate isomerase/epimerase
MMKYNRRKFLQLTGAATSGFALASMSGVSLLSSCTNKGADISTFGLQLYTLRDDMPKDPKGVLKQVAAAGYKQIESYEGPQGIFWGMSNTDFKKFNEDLGMSVIASHADITKDFEKKANEAAAIGMKYLICPWLGPQASLDEYKKKAELFNQCGEICKKAGLKFAYHNHAYSFEQVEGQFPQDVMMDNTDNALVEYEMDIYWVVTANQDPEVWLKKYKNRFRLCHIKDRIKNTTEKEATCTLGEGSINYSKVLKTAKENGMDYFVVEQERYDNTTPLKSIVANANYMKALKLS